MFKSFTVSLPYWLLKYAITGSRKEYLKCVSVMWRQHYSLREAVRGYKNS